jgi:hypothetical protein
MTGVEAIANGVPVFEEPEPRNAARTLMTLGVLLAAFVLGVTGLGSAIGAVPSDRASMIAQIGQVVAGGGPLFWLVQLSSALILVLAANTPFNGFPMLAAVMAHDWYLPRQFEHRGLRLSYYNGILVIGTLAIGLVVLFGGSTHALIPLYAVGVFLCFTLSQSGMVRHWLRVREPRWRTKLAINGLGALTTGLVTAIVVIVKFPEGAWLIALIVPALVVLFVCIHRYYMQAGEEVRVWRARPPEQQRRGHTVLVPIADLNRPAVEALVYACSISERVTAVHICLSDEEKACFRRQWAAWETQVPLVEIYSPYRLIVEPLLDYIDELNRQEPNELLTVVLPELVPMHWWENALHNQVALRLKLALFTRPGTVVTSVPYHLQC